MTQMRSFRHVNASSLSEASDLLAAGPAQAKPLAGGTDLLGTLKDEVHPDYPRLVVNLKAIPGLNEIREDGRGLRVGALATLYEVERHPVVREKFPALAEAARSVAAPQLRAMGTVAGNICQEPRCWYYRHPDNLFHCLRKGGTQCNAFTGDNRFHSIFGSATVGLRPCTAACPGEVAIPEYMAALRAGDLDGAASMLFQHNPFPAVTGRVCPHFCQGDCNRGLFDEPVSVRAVERHLGDHILENAGRFMSAPAVGSGARCAVVGSGPAGLSAALYLVQAGHQVTVFERDAEPGGMLRYAIPGYRLPVDVVRRVVAALRAAGVEFRTNVEVGSSPSLADLRRDFACVFLGPGAWGTPRLGLEQEELLESGLDLLVRLRKGQRPEVGRRVVVVGGGNVAVDVAVAVRRLGAAEVTMVCLETRDEMPALSWEVVQAEEEGVRVLTSWGPSRVVTGPGGALSGLEFVRCLSVFDESCRFSPVFDETTRQTLQADEVFLAIGQRVDVGALPGDALALESGRIVADAVTGATNLPGVFAGGDAASGPASVIAAFAAGRRAAAAITRYLAGDDAGAAPDAASEGGGAGGLAGFAPDCQRHSVPAVPEERPAGERTLDTEDAPANLDADQMAAEAARCFNCGCVASIPSDLAPVLVALEAEVVTTRRVIPVERFFRAGEARSTVLAEDELVTEVRVPAPKPGVRSTYQKFRVRKAIDFPILGVALSVEVDNARMVTGARVALGAAAPVPVRLEEVELYLVGKRLTEETATEAARLAVAGCLPLTANHYKVQVTSALVRRAILAVA